MTDATSTETDSYDVVIVGAGIAGLAAAWDLRDMRILVLDGSHRVGGRLKSEPRDGVWLNFGAHVFAGRDSAAGRLIEQTGTVALPVPGELAGLALHGKVVASGRVETYPFRLPLDRQSRVALARSGARLRLAVARYARIAAPRADEDPAERQRRMLEFMDDRSFSEFIGPLPHDVEATYRATLNRSSGEPEELAAGYGVGYFHLVWSRTGGLSRVISGGSSRLIENLAAGVGHPRIGLGCEATSVAADDTGVQVRFTRDGAEEAVRADHVVVATPAPIARRIVQNLPGETARALDGVRYGPYAVVGFLTDEPDQVAWDRIYAVATPDQPFNMLFNNANVLRDRPGPRLRHGSITAYAGATAGRRALDLDDDGIAAQFTDALERLLPHLRGRVRETVVQRWERGLPHPHVGRAGLQPALTRGLGRIHLAGDYLGTWYTETAAQTAAKAAREIRMALASRNGDR